MRLKRVILSCLRYQIIMMIDVTSRQTFRRCVDQVYPPKTSHSPLFEFKLITDENLFVHVIITQGGDSWPVCVMLVLCVSSLSQKQVDYTGRENTGRALGMKSFITCCVLLRYIRLAKLYNKNKTTIYPQQELNPVKEYSSTHQQKDGCL